MSRLIASGDLDGVNYDGPVGAAEADGHPVLLLSKHADRIEVLKGETDRVHHAVTPSAGLVGDVCFEALSRRSQLTDRIFHDGEIGSSLLLALHLDRAIDGDLELCRRPVLGGGLHGLNH